MNTSVWRTKMKKIAILTFMLMLLAICSVGQSTLIAPPPTATPSIVVTISGPGFNCSTTLGRGTLAAESWSFSSTLSIITETGTGTGIRSKANIKDLFIQKNFDNCSPALFAQLAQRKALNTVTLTQADKSSEDRRNTLLIVTLTNVFVSSYQIAGGPTSDTPVESVGFSFDKICIKSTDNGASMCYDVLKGQIY